MAFKEDLLALGFSEKSENILIKSYQQHNMLGAPQGVPFILELKLDDLENELGTNIEFRIDGQFGMSGYYKDIKDLQSSMRLTL